MIVSKFSKILRGAKFANKSEFLIAQWVLVFSHPSKLSAFSNSCKSYTSTNFVSLLYEVTSIFSEINFKVFTIESKIEIHGCHSAFDGETDTLCALMSKALYQAGKKRSVVIGHADFATPNRGGTKIISQQDYRHEERVIYNNGNVIARTRAEGRISSSFIKKALGG